MDQHQAGMAAGPTGRAAAGSNRLALYYVNPLSAGPLATWPALLDHVRDLGFTGILLAPPFAAASVLLADRLDALHPALDWKGDAGSGLAFIDQACRARGLDWLLDVVLDRVDPDGALARSRPLLYAPPSGGVADPRRGEPAATLRPQASGFAAFWAETLARWQRAGAAGFRLAGLARVPPERLAELVREVRASGTPCTILGWTDGLSDAECRALGSAGLDRTSLVLGDWDGGAEWPWHRLDLLQGVAPPVLCVETPFGPRLAAGLGDTTQAVRVLTRAVRLASLLGDAWMMPMGVEAGALSPLDPRQGSPEDCRGDLDIAETIVSANAAPAPSGPVRPVAGAGLFASAMAPASAAPGPLILVNRDLARRQPVRLAAVAASLGADPPEDLSLEPGEVREVAITAVKPIRRGRQARGISAEAAARGGRVALERIEPAVEAGRFAVKRTLGEALVVEADVLCDGHDALAAVLQYRPADEMNWSETRMALVANDRWRGVVALNRPGRWIFRIQAWRDGFASYRDELAKKTAAGIDVRLELIEGRAPLADAAKRSPKLAEHATGLERQDQAGQIRTLLSPELASLMAEADERPLHTNSAPHPVDADRVRASFASWYEVFPRSMSDDVSRHGTFRDVIRHLPRVRDMGFDVLYFPPIHPIGKTNRKGRNNSLTPEPDDPGSPYAIGSEQGGHDALHPELGTLEDFKALVAAAAEHGLEIAIDFAIQCSPDHPWLKQHKGWFAWRPDGSIRYAENPPKKYEDIVNVDFYARAAVPDLWVALCEVVLFWAEQGVRTFRVDNPHTKPFAFWEWMINEVRAAYPDAVFLAEAFTRPKIMNRLGKLGFTQSYTYFTWRNTKRELQEYLTELSTSDQRDFFRPNFFVNTPDINPPFLQESGRPGHLIRAALAATLSGLWGVYSGFELCEATPVPGKEEYLDSEKYQLRAWDWDRTGNIVAEVTRLNQIRRRNPALQTHLGVTFLPSDNDQILFFEKATPERDNVVLVAISLDPRATQSAAVELPLWLWTLPDQATLSCEDLLRNSDFSLAGKWQRVTLTPEAPYLLWRTRPAI